MSLTAGIEPCSRRWREFATLERLFIKYQPGRLLWVRILDESRLECDANPRTEARRCHKCAGGLVNLPKAVAHIEA